LLLSVIVSVAHRELKIKNGFWSICLLTCREMATYHNENRIGFNYEVNTEELRSQRRVELEQARMRSVEDDYNDDWDHITAYLDSREDKIDLKSSRRSNRSPSTIKSSSQQTPSESDSADEEGDKKVDKNDRFAIMDSINYAKRVSYDGSWLSTSVSYILDTFLE
jgi:hypothetical protein